MMLMLASYPTAANKTRFFDGNKTSLFYIAGLFNNIFDITMMCHNPQLEDMTSHPFHRAFQSHHVLVRAKAV
jgi:hypothetical protein